MNEKKGTITWDENGAGKLRWRGGGGALRLVLRVNKPNQTSAANTYWFSSESSMGTVSVNEKFKETFTWDKEMSSIAAMGGALRLFLRLNKSKNTGARSARMHSAANSH